MYYSFETYIRPQCHKTQVVNSAYSPTPVSSYPRTDAVPADTTNYQLPATPPGIGPAQELHGAHSQSAGKFPGTAAEHDGCVCEGAIGGLEGVC